MLLFFETKRERDRKNGETLQIQFPFMFMLNLNNHHIKFSVFLSSRALLVSFSFFTCSMARIKVEMHTVFAILDAQENR